jgi:diaminohydroxyphosphoribosylaminopyrimidine deaminase / 5-amino-6-(5-phosphoribosylamino)uracil reductase
MQAGHGDEDRRHMRRALQLAESGWGRVQPNPLVGAVVVRDGRVVAEGAHREFGGPHAEVEALRTAGDAARGATLYVTLEPCNHQGKTPPCTDAILGAGIGRVVFAAPDTNPHAAGGADRLRHEGLEVQGGVERDAARVQNAMFFHATERATTFVALKYAMSLDARLGREAGRPTAVTGPVARQDAHRLRAGFDAIMVGSGTVFADDPLLTVRGPVTPRRPPIRMVLASDGELPPGSHLLTTPDDGPVWIFHAADAAGPGPEARGVRAIAVPRGDDGLRLDAVLDTVWRAGVRSVLCEGGGRLGAALLRGGHVQRLYLYLAPVLYGESGVAAFPGEFPGPAAGWAPTGLRRLDPDVLLQLDRNESA